MKVQTDPSQAGIRPPAGMLVCFLGVFLSYTTFGILQESLMKVQVSNGVFFTQATCLVLFQSVFNTLVSYSVISLRGNPSKRLDTIPKSDYMMCSLMYMAAMVSSNSALKYVGYPLQVLGKSAKPVAVMLMGVLFARKRYPPYRYACVLLIVTGVALFMHKPSKAEVSKPIGDVKASKTFYGEILILCSLTFDGLTGAVQDRMLANHKVSSHRLMFQINIWASLWSWIASMATGEFWQFGDFVFSYPIVIWKMLLLSASGALGQIFIFLTVEWFGPLACSIITTTRKFFTILLSVLLFRHPLVMNQWCGAILVFTGLGMETVIKQNKKR